MNKITIPLIDKVVYIYRGSSEYKTWFKAVEKAGADTSKEHKEPPTYDYGKAYGSWLWISEEFTRNTLFHELQHYLDDLFYHIKCEDETEFKAYIAGYLYSQIEEKIPVGNMNKRSNK